VPRNRPKREEAKAGKCDLENSRSPGQSETRRACGCRDRNVEVKGHKDPPQKENPFAGCHFNIKCEGNIVFHRVTSRHFQGFRPDVITMP